MRETSRTEYSMRNSIVAFVCKALVLLFAYASRVVFVRVLDVDSAGAYGLLNNILIIFSLNSLGIDSAMVFMLYAPVAVRDLEKQKRLMRLYRSVHLAVGGAVTAAALLLWFLLPLISPEALRLPDFPLVYWLFAGNVIAGYFQSHKPMIFLADQRNYFNEAFEAGQLILQYVLQIVLLITTRSFVLYTLVFFALLPVKNAAATRFAHRKYPYLKEKARGAPPKEEKRLLGRNLWAILVQRSGVQLIGFTNTVILSGYYGIGTMAKYANYTLILTAVRQLFEKLVNGVMGSVGNLGATAKGESVEEVYRAALLLTCALYGTASVCLFEVIGLFVRLSFGPDYVYGTAITLVMCLNFYLNGIRTVTNTFRNSLGLFWNARFFGLLEALGNLLFSLGAMAVLGEVGVFIGTTLSMLAVPIWMEPRVLYQGAFRRPLSAYFRRAGLYFLAVLASGAAAHFLCGSIGGPLLLRLLLRGAVSAAVSAGLLLLMFRSTKEFKTLRASLASVLRKT